MKQKHSNLILIFVIALAITGCTYMYNRGTDPSSPASAVATISFNNHIIVSEIDGREFDPKFSIWADGKQIIRLPPGQHSFTVEYSGGYGGFHTIGPTTLSKNLVAGRVYVLGSELGRSHMGSSQRGLYEAFAIEDVTGLYDK